MDKSKTNESPDPKLRVKSNVKAGATLAVTDPPALSSGALGLRGGLSACKNNTQRTSGF